MSAHVTLNLLNELRKRDKMRDLLSILSLFRNNIISGIKALYFCHYIRNVIMDVITDPENL